MKSALASVLIAFIALACGVSAQVEVCGHDKYVLRRGWTFR